MDFLVWLQYVAWPFLKTMTRRETMNYSEFLQKLTLLLLLLMTKAFLKALSLFCSMTKPLVWNSHGFFPSSPPLFREFSWNLFKRLLWSIPPAYNFILFILRCNDDSFGNFQMAICNYSKARYLLIDWKRLSLTELSSQSCSFSSKIGETDCPLTTSADPATQV